jgi:hypothetical protein
VPRPRSCHSLIALSTSLLLLPPSSFAIAALAPTDRNGLAC